MSFGEDLQTIPSDADWKMISDVFHDQPDGKVRLLFFPTIEDYFYAGERGKRARRKEQPWPLDDESTPQTLPSLVNSSAVVDCVRYTNRRPDFLVSLSDQQYLDVFWRLQTRQNSHFPTWSV